MCGLIKIFPCLSMFRISAKVVLSNSVISDMSDGFLFMMFLYLWLMLLLVVGWITAAHFSGAKFNLRKLPCIQNSAARIVSNTSQYTSINTVLKKLHWHPVEQCIVFKTAILVYKFLHTGFPRYFAPYLSSATRLPSYETNSVAPQKSLAHSVLALKFNT